MNNSRSSLQSRLPLILISLVIILGFIGIASEPVFFAHAHRSEAVPSHNFATVNSGWAASAIMQANNCNVFGFTYNKGFAPEPSTQDRPISVVTGDFNQDGKLDLIAANLFANSISVLIGDGAGGFSMPTNLPVVSDGKGFPNALAVGDFNGDGKLDLAIAVLFNPGRVIVMNGDGMGNFAVAGIFDAGINTTAVTVGDFNGDNKPDIAVANKGEGASLGDVSVLLNDGSGGFGTATNFTAGTYPVALITGDFTGDNKNDLAVVNSGTNNISLLTGNGAGSFSPATNISVGSAPSGIAAGYFNGDTRLDLAITNSSDNNISVLIANGIGGFNSAANYPAGVAPAGIIMNDFDGNGKPDLAVTNSITNQASVLLNDGSGGFGAPAGLGVGSQPLSLASGDFNGDTKADVAVANSGSNNLSILLGKGNGTFGGTTFLLSNPQAVVMADFNADGKPDLAVANFGGDKVTLFLADGSGGYTVPNEFAVRVKPASMAVGDFNKDGKPDLVVANNGSASISILLGDGLGGFGAQTEFLGGTQPRSIAVADFNKDGNVDVVTANDGSSNLTVWLGNGDGTLGAANSLTAGSQPVSVAVADLNNDGNPDLAVANQNSAFASILLGNGAGGFSAGATLNLGAANKGRAIAIADVNNDSKPDLIVALLGQPKIQIFLGTTPGNFGAATTYDTGADPSAIVVADLDGDAKLDLAISNSGSRNLSLLKGKGDGTFDPQKVFDAGNSPIALAVGDLNNDKRIDIAVANSGSNSLSLLLNSCANTPPSITPAAAITRAQGSTSAMATLATVSDSETAAGNLTIAATNIPTGITLTDLANTAGTISAKVTATCEATLGDKALTLSVNDAAGLTTTTNFIVTVTANTAPVLGNYVAAEALLNSAINIASSAAPTDNGTIATITAAVSAGFTGTLSVNATTGATTITNAAPVGTYTVTVTATDNCGTASQKTFSLNVVPLVVITSLDPTTKQAQSGDFSLMVLGSGFTANSKVKWNGADRPTTFVSATKLTAAITNTDINAAGTPGITVFDPAAGGLTSNAVTFTITPPNPVPALTTLNPATAFAGDAGFTLTVNGSNFINSSVVKFNGADRTTTYISATQLSIGVTAADIANAGTAALTIVNPAPGGGTSNTLNLAINNPAPGSITLTPNSVLVGSAATILTVNGTGFRPNSVIKVNGADRATNVISATQLTTTLSVADLATAAILKLSVNTPPPGGGLSPEAMFTINNPAPSLTSLNPATVFAGDAAFTLNIAGTGFIAGSVVKFNGADRTTTFISATQLSIAVTAAEIASTGTITIAVANPAPGGGTSNSLSLPINNPLPVLTSLSQISAQVGSPATPVTLTGSKFRPNSIVRISGQDRAATFNSATQFSLTIPVGDLSVTNILKISVFTPAPGGGASAELNFTVGNPVPALTSLNPATVIAGGPTFTLTINGSGFVSNSIVRLNGGDRQYTLVNSTQVTISVLAAEIASAGTAKILVSNPAPAGGTSGELTLAINNPAPTTTTLSQAALTAGTGAANLTINGTGFQPNSIVRVNGQDRVTTFVSAMQLSFALLAADSANARTLKIAVFTPTPGGGISPEVNLTVNNPAPTLVSINPISAFKGDPAFMLTVNGTNFVNGSVVRWNGADRATTFVSSTQLKATIPESDLTSDGSANITVFNLTPGGGVTTAVAFTIKPLTGYEADVSPRPTGNNDGKVTIIDWVQVGRFAAGLDTVQNSSEFQRADCAPLATNGDGKLTVADWVQAGRFAVALDPVVPAAGTSRPAPAFAPTEVLSLENSQPEATRIVRARNTDFKRGELNALPLEIEAQGNENGLSFSLNYDPKVLSFSHVVTPEGWAVNVNATNVSEGRVGFMLALSTGQVIAAGKQTFLTAYFAPLGGFDPIVTKVNFDDQILARNISDVNATLLPKATYEAAAVNISGRAIANVRAASYVGPELAGDSIASAFGVDLATSSVAAAALPLPTSLAGTEIKITDSKGVERAAQLFFVSPAQVNYLIPAEMAEGSATVTISNANGVTSRGLLQIHAIAPSLFSADSTGGGVAAAQAVRVLADNSQSWEPVARYDSGSGKMVSVPIDLGENLGSKTEQVFLILFGTGIKHAELGKVQLRIGSLSVPVAYAGAQGRYTGVDQINAKIPRSLIGRGEINVELIVDGQPANVVKVNIR